MIGCINVSAKPEDCAARNLQHNGYAVIASPHTGIQRQQTKARMRQDSY